MVLNQKKEKLLLIKVLYVNHPWPKENKYTHKIRGMYNPE